MTITECIKHNLIEVLIHEKYVTRTTKTDKNSYDKIRFVYGKRDELVTQLNLTEHDLSYLINTSSTRLDIEVAIKLCKLLKAKMAAIFSDTLITEETIEDAFYSGNSEMTPNSQPLDDTDYLGFYHGYTYSSNQDKANKKIIDHFTLNIKRENNNIIAEYHGTVSKYYGRPVIINHSNQTDCPSVEIPLTNEQGRTITLSFVYHKYKSNPTMYFRIGTITTSTTSEPSCVMIRNFALFRKEVHNIDTYLRGMLKMTGSYFTIQKSVMDMYKGDPFISEFCNKYSEEKGDVLVIIEDAFFSGLSYIEESKKEPLISIMLKLKSHALEPDYILQRHGHNLADFAKTKL